MSHAEHGTRGAPILDIANFLARADVSPDEFQRVMALAKLPANGYSLQRHPAGLPDRLHTLAFLASTARSITVYEPYDIPDLLQTEQYAEAVMRRGHFVPGKVIAEGMTARQKRQAVFEDDKRDCDSTFYIDEFALRNPAMRDHMGEQLVRLALATCRQRCHIRIVPATGVDRDIRNGFALFQNAHDDTVLTVNTLTAMVISEQGGDLAPYQQKIRTLETTALNELESVDRINAIATTVT